MATAMSMMDKTAASTDRTPWPRSLTDEFSRESERPNSKHSPIEETARLIRK